MGGGRCSRPDVEAWVGDDLIGGEASPSSLSPLSHLGLCMLAGLATHILSGQTPRTPF